MNGLRHARCSVHFHQSVTFIPVPICTGQLGSSTPSLGHQPPHPVSPYLIEKLNENLIESTKTDRNRYFVVLESNQNSIFDYWKYGRQGKVFGRKKTYKIFYILWHREIMKWSSSHVSNWRRGIKCSTIFLCFIFSTFKEIARNNGIKTLPNV